VEKPRAFHLPVQSSVICFIKDNRKLGRIGNGSNERGHRNAGRLVQLQQLRPWIRPCSWTRARSSRRI